MGGRGSGSLPDDIGSHRGGRSKKSALAVTGSGAPVMPRALSADAAYHWELLTERLSGVVFEQDSHILGRMAIWMSQLTRLDGDLAVLQDGVSSEDDGDGDGEAVERLIRTMLAIERNLDTKCAKFGMTPRDRQLLLMPKEEEELDAFEQMIKDRE